MKNKTKKEAEKKRNKEAERHAELYNQTFI